MGETNASRLRRETLRVAPVALCRGTRPPLRAYRPPLRAYRLQSTAPQDQSTSPPQWLPNRQILILYYK